MPGYSRKLTPQQALAGLNRVGLIHIIGYIAAQYGRYNEAIMIETDIPSKKPSIGDKANIDRVIKKGGSSIQTNVSKPASHDIRVRVP